MIDWGALYNNLTNKNEITEHGEWHHIIPKHSGGTDDITNLVYLSRRSHILAHYIRYRWLNESGDFSAYKLMSGQIFNPMFCEFIHKKHIEIMNSPEVKSKIIAASIKRWSSDEERKRHSLMRKLYINNNPEYKAKLISQICNKKVWDKVAAALKVYRKNNPEKIKQSQIKAGETLKKNNSLRTESELKKIYGRPGKHNPKWKGYCYIIKDDNIIAKFESFTLFSDDYPGDKGTLLKYVREYLPLKKGEYHGCFVKISKEEL